MKSVSGAERLGFEPRVQSPVRRISSAVHSTSLASLLVQLVNRDNGGFLHIGHKSKDFFVLLQKNQYFCTN